MKREAAQYSQLDDVLFRRCLCGWWWSAGQASVCWWRWLIRGRVLGKAVSPLCPNHVLLCHSVWRGGGGGGFVGGRREKTKTNLNATYCLVDIATPLMNREPQLHKYLPPTRCNRCVKSFQSETNGRSCEHMTTNYKSRLKIILVVEPVLLPAVIWAAGQQTTPFQRKTI